MLKNRLFLSMAMMPMSQTTTETGNSPLTLAPPAPGSTVLSLVEQVAAADAPEAMRLLAAEIDALKGKISGPAHAAEVKFSQQHPKAAKAILAAGTLLKKVFPQTAGDLATLAADLDI